MGVIIDPVTGQPINVPGVQPSMYGGAANPALQPILPQIPMANYSYGKPVPLETSDYGTALGVQKDVIDQLFDARTGAMASILYGTPSFDWGYAQGQTNPFLGGGGGGGWGGGYSSDGGGGGGGYVPEIYNTPVMDSLQNTQSQVLKIARDQIAQGMDPTSVKFQIQSAINADPTLAAGIPDIAGKPGSGLETVFGTVDKLFDEKAGFQRTQLQNQQNQMAYGGGDNPLMDYAKQWGLPMGTYGPGNWPADLQGQINRFLPSSRQQLGRIRRRMGDLPTQARYQPVPESETLKAGTVAPGDYNRYLNQVVEPGGITSGTELGAWKQPDDSNPPGFLGGPNYLDVAAQGTKGSGAYSSRGGYGNEGPSEAEIKGTGYGRSPSAGSGIMWAQRESNPAWGQPTELPFEVQIRGEPYWTNQAGQQYQNLANRYQRVSNYQQKSQNQYNQAVTNYLAQQGRTPARDALMGRMDALRSMGLAI